MKAARCDEVPTADKQDVERKVQRSAKTLRRLKSDIVLFIVHQLQPSIFASSSPYIAILTHESCARSLFEHLRIQRTTAPHSMYQLVGLSLSASSAIELCTVLNKVVDSVCDRFSRDSGVAKT